MNTTTDITLKIFIITTLLLYLIGLIAIFQSIKKYKYSKLWFAVGLLLFICPPFILVLISLCEKAEIKKNSSDVALLKAKIKVNISTAIFVFYYSLYPLFAVFLKYSSVNKDWYQEIALVCINIVMLALIPLYLYVKRKIKTIEI